MRRGRGGAAGGGARSDWASRPPGHGLPCAEARNARRPSPLAGPSPRVAPAWRSRLPARPGRHGGAGRSDRATSRSSRQATVSRERPCVRTLVLGGALCSLMIAVITKAAFVPPVLGARNCAQRSRSLARVVSTDLRARVRSCLHVTDEDAELREASYLPESARLEDGRACPRLAKPTPDRAPCSTTFLGRPPCSGARVKDVAEHRRPPQGNLLLAGACSPGPLGRQGWVQEWAPSPIALSPHSLHPVKVHTRWPCLSFRAGIGRSFLFPGYPGQGRAAGLLSREKAEE